MHTNGLEQRSGTELSWAELLKEDPGSNPTLSSFLQPLGLNVVALVPSIHWLIENKPGTVGTHKWFWPDPYSKGKANPHYSLSYVCAKVGTHADIYTNHGDNLCPNVGLGCGDTVKQLSEWYLLVWWGLQQLTPVTLVGAAEQVGNNTEPAETNISR